MDYGLRKLFLKRRDKSAEARLHTEHTKVRLKKDSFSVYLSGPNKDTKFWLNATSRLKNMAKNDRFFAGSQTILAFSGKLCNLRQTVIKVLIAFFLTSLIPFNDKEARCGILALIVSISVVEEHMVCLLSNLQLSLLLMVN